MAKSASVTCPLCGEIVKSGYLRAHKASAHGEAVSPANSIKRTVKNMSQTKQDGEVFVQCPDCPKKLKKKKLAEHRRKKHPTKAQKLRKILGPDEETRIEFANRRVSLSGGGFGVGKGKKR